MANIKWSLESVKNQFLEEKKESSGKCCEHCGKKNNPLFGDPVYLLDERFLCNKCGEPIKKAMEDIYYNSKTKEAFKLNERKLLEIAVIEYDDNIVKLIEDKVKKEYDNKTFYEFDVPTIIDNNIYGEPIFSLNGCRGRRMFVFDNYVVIKVTVTAGSIITGNATDGEKVIFYKDCIGLQYKDAGLTIGYIQLETASSQMNGIASNQFNENTFTFDDLNDPDIKRAYKFIFDKVAEIKNK